MRKKIMPWVATAMLAAFCAGAAQPAVADTANAPTTIKQRVNDTLAHSSQQGTRIAPNKISWDNGKVVTEYFPASQHDAAAYKCSSGAFCVYQFGDHTGTKASFYAYDRYYLSKYDMRNRVSSWVNNQTGSASGKGYAYYNSDGDTYEVWGAGSNDPDRVEHASLVGTSADNVTDVVDICADVCH